MSILRTVLLCSTFAGSPVLAGDWPQILGPHRNGVAEGERIVDKLPAKPKPLWTRSVGDGFAGVAVADGTAYLFHRVGDQEVVEAMNVKTGKVVWKSGSSTSYSGAIASDDGPRCVPVITDDAVIVFGAQGRLRCLDRKTGDERWSNSTHESFEVLEGYFGAGSSPIVEGDALLVNVGASRDEAGLVAFDLKTGEVRWKSTDEQASYSSPVAATIGGKRQIIFVTRYNAAGVEPESGKVLWSFPFGARGATVNGASPVLVGDHLFLTASYGVGAAFAKLGPDAAEELWTSADLLSSQYTTPIAHDGVVFGIDGRQDVGVATLRCIDPIAKQVLWDEAGFGYATLIKADGKLLVQKTDGTLVLVKPDKTGYRELSRASLASGTTRVLPALSDGLYFIRDETTLYCYDLSP
ncbi:MAG: PQQ-binding-like beta-propeller repeat protein [Planctomycetaceae bacterium]